MRDPEHSMNPILRFLAAATVASVFFMSNSRAQSPVGTAVAIVQERSASATGHAGSTIAYVYDVASGTATPESVPGDEVTLPNIGEAPLNPVLLEVPVRPGRRSFAKIVFDNGSGGFCSATAIGRRTFITAGHCVFDRDASPRAFKKSAIVYPGYSLGYSKDQFKARRFVAFNGWTSSGDYAHDIALVEVDTDLPSDIVPFVLSSDAYACGPNGAFDRHYYKSGSDEQLRINAPHIGCQSNQYFWSLGTFKGSSGSAAC